MVLRMLPFVLIDSPLPFLVPFFCFGFERRCLSPRVGGNVTVCLQVGKVPVRNRGRRLFAGALPGPPPSGPPAAGNHVAPDGNPVRRRRRGPASRNFFLLRVYYFILYIFIIYNKSILFKSHQRFASHRADEGRDIKLTPSGCCSPKGCDRLRVACR